MNSGLETPVAFIIYKRPETTQRVFEVIRKARPKRLFVIADGPRTPDVASNCAAARAVINTLDWDCDIQTNYSVTNLGLKRRVSSGIDWVFEHVEEAIILEDDCLPDTTFFRFCNELLRYYRDEPQIMHISGNNFLRGRVPIDTSYYFSRYTHIWGWATWRRAWQHFDVNMKLWKEMANKEQFLARFENSVERDYWRYRWKRVASGIPDTWASQWLFTCIAFNGYAAIPRKNLVSNIGAGVNASNTYRQRLTHNMATSSLNFPLEHPTSIMRNKVADKLSAHDAILNAPSGNLWFDRARWLVKAIKWRLG